MPARDNIVAEQLVAGSSGSFSLTPSVSRVAACLCLGLRRARVAPVFTSLWRAVGLLGCVLWAFRGVRWLVFVAGLVGLVGVHVLGADWLFGVGAFLLCGLFWSAVDMDL